ncbi:CS025 protein, partial [Polyodon spathula]|nr:CS025 protein [Polyodon spathula]
MSSKGKKRVVLPTRPDQPSVDHILEDIAKASPNDPVFVTLQEASEDLPGFVRGGGVEAELEGRYQQCWRYYQLNEELQGTRSELAARREALRRAGEQLEQSAAEIKSRAL